MVKILLSLLVVIPIAAWPDIASADDPESVEEEAKSTELSDEEALQILKDHKGRVELQKALKLFEENKITEEEYEKRVQEIRKKYLIEKTPEVEEIDPCEGISCSSHGSCVVTDGKPVCECREEEGYVVDPETEQDCMPAPISPGWARTAAILGLVATPTAALLTASSYGTNSMENYNGSLALQILDLGVFGIMGPTLAVGSASARKSPDVTGVPYVRLGANVLYVGGAVLGAVMVPIDAGKQDPPGWHTLLWGGMGSLSLLLHTIDAAVSYRQAANALYGNQEKNTKRPWTWTALAVGIAAAAGAVPVGLRARDKRNELDDFSPSEALCEDVVVGGENQLCSIREAELEAKKWSGATDILIGTAATGLVLGATLFFIEPLLPCPKIVKDVSVTPFASPIGAGLMLGGRF